MILLLGIKLSVPIVSIGANYASLYLSLMGAKLYVPMGREILNILTLENVSKGFSEKNLFENLSMGIDDSDRIGLVGVNGIGKTTFLKLISGQLLPDSGKVVRSNNLRIQFLSQTPSFDENISVIDNILQGDNPVIRTIREYEDAADRFNRNPDDEKIQAKFMELTSEMDSLDAWNMEAQAKTVLDRLGITDTDRIISELSGGQRKRVALAEALIQPADLLILDEPTNHIDLETINWLEEFLSQRKGALLLVTHDRYFLNRIVNRIIELDKGKLYSYDGNFEYFLEKKTQREEFMAASEEKRRRLFVNELAWIRRGAKARTTKQKARIQRFEEIKKSEITISKEQIEIPVAYTRLGKKAIEINNISKSFDGQAVIKNLSMIISPDDRIGIVGPNGAGKTTLLNLIAQILSPDSGAISFGETVRIAYYRQENTDLDPSLRAIDYIKETAEYVQTEDGRTISAARMLEQFLFDDVQRYTHIKNLSGGEKRRLLLAKVLMEKPNVLLLDEPTNDLDIQTLEVLEEYLSYFRGVVLISSHDRYFLEKTTDRLIAVKGDGKIEFFTSVDTYNKSLPSNRQKTVNQKAQKQLPKNKTDNLSEKAVLTGQIEQSDHEGQSWQIEQPDRTRQLEQSSQSVKSDQPVLLEQLPQKTAGRKSTDTTIRPKFTYNETREFTVIDDEIEKLENRLEEITAEMKNHWSDHIKIKELSRMHEETRKELDLKMQRWIYLNEKAEQIKSFDNNK